MSGRQGVTFGPSEQVFVCQSNLE